MCGKRQWTRGWVAVGNCIEGKRRLGIIGIAILLTHGEMIEQLALSTYCVLGVYLEGMSQVYICILWKTLTIHLVQVCSLHNEIQR